MRGVKYALIGHSERRKLGETNEIINKKLGISLSLGLKVIFCVGEETKGEEGKSGEFIEQQINEGLKRFKPKSYESLIIAYEPVWAISGNAKSRRMTRNRLSEWSVLHQKNSYRYCRK